MPDGPARRDFVPSSAIPIAYFAFAHVALASALGTLAVFPTVPGRFFYHPRMIALVHLVTLGWVSASILGAFYIVGPLALRLPMPVGRVDWAAFTAFAVGTLGMVSHFWIGEYSGMVWSSGLVVAAVGWVANRAWGGLVRAPVPWPVKLHVALAFFNILVAAAIGILAGIGRSRGMPAVSPLAVTYAHAHVAAIGWAMMMVVGLSYRLIPMMLPAAMPTGASLALSAVLIEAGLMVVLYALVSEPAGLPVGGGLVVAGLASFMTQIRRAVKQRMPRPPALPRRDWSVWQIYTAFMWLLVAIVLGLALSVGVSEERYIAMSWVYGVAGLVGFLTQIVVGMQGRLVPLYAWYRAFAAAGDVPPPRSANDLPASSFARSVFLIWAFGVPYLAWSLVAQNRPAIVASSMLLLVGVCVGGAYLTHMLRAAETVPKQR
jgi:hypothetical protein